MTTPDDSNNNNTIVSFVVTGFGPFRNAKENPTTIIANQLKEYLANTNETSLSLHTTTRVIETSAQAARQEVDNMMNVTAAEDDDEAAAESDNDAPNNTTLTTVYLHLGVNYKGTKFQLEQCAYNDATFRIPDERQYQPRNKCIVEEADLGSVLQTTLDLNSLCNSLAEEESKCTCPIITSTDPGRFVCNYTYYCSLYQTQQQQDDNNQIHSLFVHVPPFSVIPQEEQLKTVVQIMKRIEQQLTQAAPTPLSC